MNRQHRQIVATLQKQLAGAKVRLPPEASILWDAFSDLSQARTWHGHGANPISYPDIEAYCRIMRLPLEPHHVKTLMAMDRVWLAHVSAQMVRGGKDGVKRLAPASKHKLTPQLMDALLG